MNREKTWADCARHFRRMRFLAPEISTFMLGVIDIACEAGLDKKLFAVTSHSDLVVTSRWNHPRDSALSVALVDEGVNLRFFDGQMQEFTVEEIHKPHDIARPFIQLAGLL